MNSIVPFFQVACGVLWLTPLILFAPAVARVWRGTGDPIDVILSPLAFLSADQSGFSIRWVLFPHAIKVMPPGEILLWTGLYTLSALCALGLVVAWRVARGGVG